MLVIARRREQGPGRNVQGDARVVSVGPGPHGDRDESKSAKSKPEPAGRSAAEARSAAGRRTAEARPADAEPRPGRAAAGRPRPLTASLVTHDVSPGGPLSRAGPRRVVHIPCGRRRDAFPFGRQSPKLAAMSLALPLFHLYGDP